MNSERYFAIVSDGPPTQKSRHYVGVPPELVDGQTERVLLPRAQVVVIERLSDGVFLYRYSASGTVAGDTWHSTIQEAREQAVFEYGDALGRWMPIPREAGDAVKYALSQAGERQR